jgi:transmembrane sensor
VIEERRRDAEHDPIHATAAEWFARLHDNGLSLEETMEWQQWLAADRRHAAAFARIEDVWNEIGSLRAPAPPQESTIVSDRYDGSVTVSSWQANRKFRNPLAARRFFMAASVAGVALAVLLLGYFITKSGIEVLHTQIGENRTFALPDGTRLNLGAASKVEYEFDASSRRLRLVRGEAFFTVAKDPLRPFRVQAGTASVTAVGTQFNVRRGSDRTVVAVLEGQVVVAAAATSHSQTRSRNQAQSDGQASRTMPLKAGEQIVVGTGGIGRRTEISNSAAATGWQSGRLAFEGEQLRYVLEYVNRYSSRPILAEGEEVGRLAITGTLMSNNIQGWVASLEHALPVDVVEAADHTLIRLREAPAVVQ